MSLSDEVRAKLEGTESAHGTPIPIKHEERRTRLTNKNGETIGVLVQKFVVINANDFFNAQWREEEKWFAAQEKQYRDLI